MELHFHCKAISKGTNGRTACGSAAYRSCTRIIDNNGEVHDYTNKEGHIRGGVVLPAGASEELCDLQTLWQRHEIKDIRKDAQLYRDIEVAFPNELSYDAIERVTLKVCRELADEGMCIQWDIHDNEEEAKKGLKERNKHVHMMSTMRELLEDGTFGNKNRSWNRYNGGLNIADLLREEVANLMNEELATIGSEEKVEFKSFEERGIDRIPTGHIGVAAMGMERKGIKTDRKANNDEIKRINKEHRTYLEKLEEYRKKREEVSRVMIENAQQAKEDMMRLMEAAENVKSFGLDGKELKEPEAPSREKIYKEIKECNQQSMFHNTLGFSGPQTQNSENDNRIP